MSIQRLIASCVVKRVCCGLAALLGSLLVASASAQGPLPIQVLPLGKDIGLREGQSTTPAYEGWYELEDGRIALSFGYNNRNSEEVMEIPIGPANRIIGAADGEADQGQPTVFEPHRHWGVFTVVIPADYEEQVVWHLENRGQTFHIPANLDTDYVIDAIVGDANGNFPPEIRFAEDGAMGHGPFGLTAGPMQVRVGRPLTVQAWVRDDGKASGLGAAFLGGGNRKPPVTVTWFKHSGPGEVSFSETAKRVPVDGGVAATEATFAAPGDYVLRARVTEFTGPEMAGHSQCCWTNGYVQVTVTQ